MLEKYYIMRKMEWCFWGGGHNKTEFNGWKPKLEQATMFDSYSECEKMVIILNQSDKDIKIHTFFPTPKQHFEEDYERAMRGIK